MKTTISLLIVGALTLTGCRTTSSSVLDVTAHAEAPAGFLGRPGCDVHVAYHLETESK